MAKAKNTVNLLEAMEESQVLAISLTNEYLASVEYDDILNRYKVLHSNY